MSALPSQRHPPGHDTALPGGVGRALRPRGRPWWRPRRLPGFAVVRTLGPPAGAAGAAGWRCSGRPVTQWPKGAVMSEDRSPDRGTNRVIVGVDGSLACMGALRRAVTEARRAGASLYAVAVVQPWHRYDLELPDPRAEQVALAAGHDL